MTQQKFYWRGSTITPYRDKALSNFTKKILHEVLKFRQADPVATNVFSSWTHDADLLPRFKVQLDAAFDAFYKYQRISHDIQGFRDEGTDILLREASEDGQNSYFCFQIKGEWDIEQPDYLKTLKAQFFDTQRRYQDRLEEYFIVLCFRVVMENKKRNRRFARDRRLLIDDPKKRNKVREIARTFAVEKATVIELQYAMSS